MKKLLRLPPLDTDLGVLLLRLFFGGMFIYFGWGKIENYNMILPQFGDIIGIGSKLSFNLVIFGEFVCGILITLGLFTRLSVIPSFITMVVAFFVAHANDAFADKIPAFSYLILSVIIFINGSGKYSVDALIFNRKQPESN
ncbi:DoxX family protein [Flavobacterium sp. RHBU_3]|uniref:DoxX family protein n=1 Tax=Flavobacterium sp. RHBU_3 TaxID=3391184 RepID=UPI0039848052